MREWEGTQQEIFFYRDEWWGKDGGTLYGELRCLVPAVQMALAGAPQSLAQPDYSVPFMHFQYGVSGSDAVREWVLRGPADVARFEIGVRPWLSDIALPWLEQFETIEGVLDFMRRERQRVALARVLASLGRKAEARALVHEWIGSLPRQIEATLGHLVQAGLLSSKEAAALGRAALQSEEQYRQLVRAWIADKEET